MHTLLFHEPGHFHAALLLKSTNPRVDRTVHVYATPGPDLDRFVALVEGFNSRAEAPTDWLLELHTGAGSTDDEGPLAALIVERRGEVVIVAGRNEPKLAVMRELHEAGFTVLADKPWITSPAALPHLERITAGPPTALDIMTGRHDLMNRLCHRIVSDEEIFADFAGSSDPDPDPDPDRHRHRSSGAASEPDLAFASVHHLCKTVDGRSLVRPPWYYDVAVQGDGLVDIHSHLVDQAQWLIEARRPAADQTGFGRDITIERAERWSTEVSLGDFTESTGLDRFPDSLADRLSAPPTSSTAIPVLDLACNGRIDYRLRGVLVRQETVWRVRAAQAGSGDEHTFIARGTGCTVQVDDGPDVVDGPELRLIPAGDDGEWSERLARRIEEWQDEFPGLSAEALDRGHRLVIPDALATPHEAMFTVVLNDVLDRVEQGVWSATSAATIRDRYTLLARAHQIATTD